MNYWSFGRFNEATARLSLLLEMKYCICNFADESNREVHCLLRTMKRTSQEDRSFKGTSGICCRSKLFSGERAAGTMPHYLLLGWFLPADGLLKGRSDAATSGLRLPPWTNDITARGCGSARRPCRWRRKALRDPLLQKGWWVLSIDCSPIDFCPMTAYVVRQINDGNVMATVI